MTSDGKYHLWPCSRDIVVSPVSRHFLNSRDLTFLLFLDTNYIKFALCSDSTYIPQVFSTNSKNIFKSLTTYNANVHITKCIFPNPVPKGRTDTVTYPPIVGPTTFCRVKMTASDIFKEFVSFLLILDNFRFQGILPFFLFLGTFRSYYCRRPQMTSGA